MAVWSMVGPTLVDCARIQDTMDYNAAIARQNTYLAQGMPTFYIPDEGVQIYPGPYDPPPEPDPEDVPFREQKEKTQRLEYDTLLARRDRTRPKEAENNGYHFFPDWAHSTTAMVWDVVRILGRLLQDGVAIYDVWADETKSISGLDTPRKMGVS